MGQSKSRAHKSNRSQHETLEAMGGRDGSEQVPRQLPTHHQGAITGIACGGPGKVVTCGNDQTVCVLDWRRGEVVRVWRGHSNPVNKVVCYQGAGTLHVFSCSRDMTIKHWVHREGHGDPVSQKCAEDIQATHPRAAHAQTVLESEGLVQTYEGHELTVSAIDVSSDGRLLCSGSRDVTVRVWDVERGGACVASRKIPRNLVTCIKWFNNEPCFVQGSEDLHVRVWDHRSKPLDPVVTLGGYTYFPLCVDVTDDGNQILTSSKGFNSVGAEAKIWDRRMGRVVTELCGHAQDATACAFLPRAPKHMVATASKDQTIRVWDVAARKEESIFTDVEGSTYTGLARIDPTADSDVACLAASTFNGGVYIFRQDVGVRADCPHTDLTCIARVPPSADEVEDDVSHGA